MSSIKNKQIRAAIVPGIFGKMLKKIQDAK
jgi:hypothetical protein